MLSSEYNSDFLILHLDEPRVDMVTARKFRDSLSSFVKDNPPNIILNLQKTDYFDSSALGALVAFMKDVNAYNGKLILCNLSRSIYTLLKLSRLDSIFLIADTVEDALAGKLQGS
jgi:anti-sigma B factor antagonist